MSTLSDSAILEAERRRRLQTGGGLVAVAAVIVLASYYVGLLDGRRLAEGLPALLELMANMVPPAFASWQSWIAPLIDTLAMSIAGTAMAVVFSVPLAFAAARNTTPNAAVMLNLRYVATFLAVVRTASFRAAAAELGLSPATVSHQIRRLETVVGADLLERGGAPCRPTAAGARLLPHAESLMRLNTRALEAVTEQPLRLGASSNIGIYLLPPLIQRLRRRQPASPRLSVRIAGNPEIVGRLDEGTVDLALVESWQPRTGFEATRWRDEPMVVIVPPDHPWAGRRGIAPEELAETRLLAGEPGTGTGRLLRELLAGCAQPPAIAAQLGSTEAVKHAVAHGQGISVVLAGAVSNEVADGRLAAIPVTDPGLTKPLWAVWRRSSRAPGREAVLDALRAGG